MALKVPEVVRQTWGDPVVVEFVPWLERTIEETVAFHVEQAIVEKAVPRDEYRHVLSRLDILEHDMAEVKEDVRELRREMNERFDRVNERFDQMNDRFDQMTRHFEARLDEMNHRFEARLDEMNHRFDARLDQMNERMLVQTRWLIGSIALFGTIITVLMAIAQFTP